MRHPFFIPAAIFALAFAFYVATLAPSVEWGDFGGYQTRITLGELELAPQGHPLWNLISRPFPLLPFGDAAFRVNLSSAFFGALALAVLYAGLMRLTRSTLASVLAVIALAVSHTFWTYAVVPKAYTLTMLILALCILWLHEWRAFPHVWRIAAVGLLLGLGVMNHLIVITAVPGMAVFLIWHSRHRIRDVIVAGGAFIIGLVPYVYLLSTAPAKGATTGNFISSYLEKFAELLTSPQQLLFGLALTVGNLGYQFLLLTFVGLWGWWLLAKRDRSFALMLALIFVGDVAFVLIPTDPPVMMHWHLYHPAYLVFAFPLAFGIDDLLRRWGDLPIRRLEWAAVIILPVVVIYFFLAPGVARAMHITERLGVRDFPGRDTVSYLFTPSKAGDWGPRHYGEAALDSLPPGAVIFADWTPYAVLWYLQSVEGRRRDVTLLELPSEEPLLNAIDRELAAGHQVFLADNSRYYTPDALSARYELVSSGPSYRVVKRP